MSALASAPTEQWRLAARRSMTLPATLGLTVFVALSHVEASIEAVRSGLGLSAVLFGVAILAGVWGWRTARRFSRRGLYCGAAVFGFLALVWLASRTTGLPLGLAPPAPAGVLDSATAFDELLVVAGTLILARDRPRAESAYSGFAFLAVGISFMLLSMGCSIGTAHAPPHGFIAQGIPLFCHLY